MTFLDAALASLYPVMIILGVTIWMRYRPILRYLAGGTRAIVCANLVIVATNVLEQIMYGYGRLLGRDVLITISLSPWLVGILKIGYIIGYSYLLYSFWLLTPARPRIWIPFMMAALIWAMVTVALMI